MKTNQNNTTTNIDGTVMLMCKNDNNFTLIFERLTD